jgi:uncharacterized sporulation protein YeaH/YhbH (DUF444 family)
LLLAGAAGILFFWITDPRSDWRCSGCSAANPIDTANRAILGTVVGLAGSVAVLVIGLWLLERRLKWAGLKPWSWQIEKDHQRFRQIVKGRIRDDLRKFLTKGELIGKEGKHLISIPVRGIELPHFRYGDNSGGVGAGDGKEGDVVGKGPGKARAGTEPGQHIMEVDLTLDELAEILAEELKLPRIEPKGKHRITTVRDKYSGIRRVGPESLRHFKRSFKEALKRQIMMAITTRSTRSSSRSARTSATEAGRKSRARSPTRSSSS